MATTIVTGRDITFTLATVNYDAQTTSVTLVNAPVIDVYQTLDNKAYKHVDDQWTLKIELLADWGVASSLFEAMWTAFTSAPNTALAFTLLTATGASFAGNVFQSLLPLAEPLQALRQIPGRCYVQILQF